MSLEIEPQHGNDIQSDKDDISERISASFSTKEIPVVNDSAQYQNEVLDTSELAERKKSHDDLEQLDGLQLNGLEKSRSNTKVSERVKQKSWYNIIYPSYKSRCESFKKLFKEIPEDQRLIVDYSCALQREILVHGRMYVTLDYMCFHANIFGWETYLTLKWKSVTAITKEKTALVIPNAILLTTDTEKYFITSFAGRDKSYLMLFRIWQNALMNKLMSPQEIWQCVHNSYGEKLGLTSDDEDYIDPRDENDRSAEDEANTDIEQSSTPPIEMEKLNENMASASNTNGYLNGVNESNSNDDSTFVRVAPSKLRMRKELDTNDIPTDESFSTDSEDETSVPFELTAECTSLHEGRQLLHTILPINIDSLLTMLFSKSKFFVEFHNIRKTTNMVYRDWVENDDGTKTRKLNFTVAVTQAVGPKSSNMTEIQVMRDCSAPGQLYSIDIKSTNAGIPYADSFHTLTHFCLVRAVDDHTMLSVYVQIKYTKSVWGVIKGFIEKNAWAGLENFYKDLLKALQSECRIPPAKSKSRRNKKALALSQKSSFDDSSKKSTLKSATKAMPAQLVEGQTPTDVTGSNFMSSQCSNEMLPYQGTARNYLTCNMLPIFVLLLIFMLILLNCYLLVELYTLKHKQTDSIHIDRKLLDQLSGDPNEIRQNWFKLLNQQNVIHESELAKWQGFIKSAVDLLQNIKKVYIKFNAELNESNNINDEL